MAKRKKGKEKTKEYAHPVLGTSLSMAEQMFTRDNGNGKEFSLPPLIYPDSVFLYGAQKDHIPSVQENSWKSRWKVEEFPPESIPERKGTAKKRAGKSKRSLKQIQPLVVTTTIPQVEKEHEEKVRESDEIITKASTTAIEIETSTENSKSVSPLTSSQGISTLSSES